MTRFRATIAAALVVATAAWTAAQVRDSRGVSPATAAAGVGGRVEIENNGQRAPLRRAKVTLKSEAGGQTWTTASDADGRFQFDVVAAGRYQLLAEKAGFVPTSRSVPLEIQVAATASVALGMQRAAALEGRFVDFNGDPIPRLTVTADRMPDAQGGGVAAAHSAVTDDLGRFRVHTLPPGRYRLHATPPPPASGASLFYPGTGNPAEATVIAVAAGETRDGLDVTVPAAPLSSIAAEALAAADRSAQTAPEAAGFSARISGRITRTDTGQPIANALAELVSIPGAVLSIRNVARTNGDGRFEFTRLAGGQYDLTATAIGFVGADARMRPGGPGMRVAVKDDERNERADVKLMPASAIEVRLLDEFGDPAPGVVLQITQQTDVPGIPRFMPGVGGAFATTGPTDDRGWFRAYGLFPGDYYLIALPEPFERSGPAGFATTFFPGTRSADAAAAVHVVAGREALDVRFSLLGAKITTLAGVVRDAAGRPAPKSEVLLLPTENGEVRTIVMARTATDADGSFSYHDVPEGTYVLQGMAAGGFGSLPVTVSATSASEPGGVALTLRPLITARGRVSFEGNAAPPDARGVTIGFQPTDFTSGPIGSNRIAAEIAADWSFRIPDLAWYGVLRVTAQPGWTLARVMLQGRDITDTPSDFQTADVSGLEVVLTSRVGTLSGTVISAGLPAAGVTVLVFGADSPSWTSLSRTLRGGQSNAQGTFTVSGLVPGRYLAVALPTGGQALNPTSLLALRSVATPVVVSEGAKATVVLTTVK